MKYLITGLNFLVENPQAPSPPPPPIPLENFIPPCGSAPPPPPRKQKSASATLLKNISKFLGSPCRKGGRKLCSLGASLYYSPLEYNNSVLHNVRNKLK